MSRRFALAGAFFPFLTLLYFFASAQAAPLPVLVSIPPQKYFVERIGGDTVAVTAMVAKGRDPHSYEPTASQMAKVSKAQLYFAIGVPFEVQWLPRIQAMAKDMTVVRHSRDQSLAATEKKTDGPEPDHAASSGHAHSDDPHIWVSPVMVRHILPEIRDALSKANPDKAELYRKNTEILIAEVDALNKRITELFSSVPPQKRVFLSLHEGWSYYARNFALTELTVELDGKEPGPKSMAAIIKEAKEHGVTTVLVDASTSNATAKALTENLKARLIRANPLEENWPDFLWSFSTELAQSLNH